MSFEWGKNDFLYLPTRPNFTLTQTPLKSLFSGLFVQNIAVDFIPFHREIKKNKTPPSFDGGVNNIMMYINQIYGICGL